jgi:hypothetical protein
MQQHDDAPEIDDIPPPTESSGRRKKKPLVVRAENIARAINLEGSVYPIKWPYLYRTVEFEKGIPVVFEELAGQQLVLSSGDDLPNRIAAWVRLHNLPDELLLLRDARQVADLWRAISTPIPLNAISNVRWQGEVGYTWHRLPWKFKPGPSPTWDAMLSKMTNARAFRHWLGSLFFDEAKQHQYVWVYGQGNDGKGSINRFLARVFGRAYRSKQPPAPSDKFWTYGLLGARLVVFPDCNSQGFTSSGLFKSLTGGDPIDVEAKGRMSFTAKLGCKFLFFSNENPNISSEHADMRRIIYCEFERNGGTEPGFEERLWAEGGAFLSTCVADYAAAHPGHTPIESDAENIRDWVSMNEEPFEQAFAQRFQQPNNELYRTHAALAALSLEQLDLVTVRPEVMLNALKEAFPEHRERQQFKMWMLRKYGVKKKSIRLAATGQTLYRYVGVCGRQGLRLSTSDYIRHPN